jgi:hypothetical protein
MFDCEYDAFIPVSGEMGRPLAQWLIAKLKEYSSAPFEQDKLIKRGSIEARRFRAKHHCVDITLYADGSVRVQALGTSTRYVGERESDLAEEEMERISCRCPRPRAEETVN